MAPAQTIEPKDLPPELAADPAVPMPMPVQVPGRPAASGTPAPVEMADGSHGAATAASGLPGAAAESHGVPRTAPAPAAEADRVVPVSSLPASANWLAGLEQDARARLQAGETEVWEALTRKFEAQLIHTALEITRGRRIEAAQKLGIGRNTITRKIQELGLDD